MRKRQRLMVAGALVLGLVLGAAVLAVAGNGGVIYACVNNDSGTVKIVDADTVCNENWTLTTWNQEGAPGAAGADGQDGADGTDGAGSPLQARACTSPWACARSSARSSCTC